MEGWKDGWLEDWKIGRLGDWEIGDWRLVDWGVGRGVRQAEESSTRTRRKKSGFANPFFYQCE